MAIPREQEDLLFARYRKRGDPDLLAQVFDHTAARLLRLAFHLSRDPAEAEDLVQATFVTAIEKARHFDTDRPVLPWLTGILENHAREARTSAFRRIVPERLRGRPVTTPPQHAESKELDEAVARGLDKLPERYRPVMVLKLRHGLKPAQIADALGRSPGAVRVQIHRGTELLRNYLPVGLGLSSALAMTPTLGLAAMRSEIRRHAAAHCAVAVQAVGIGGLLMKKTTTVALGLFLAAGAGLYVTSGSEPVPFGGDRGTERGGTGGTHAGSLTADADLGSERVPVAASERSTLAPAAGLGGGILVRTLWEDDRSPASGIGLTIRPHDGRHPDLHTERQVTGRDGSILFGGLEAGDYGVYVDRDARRPEDLAGSLDPEPQVWEVPGLPSASGDMFVTREAVIDVAVERKANLVYSLRSVQTDFTAERSVRLEGLRFLPGIEAAADMQLDEPTLEELREMLKDLRASSRLPDETPVAVETVADEVVYVDVLLDRGLVVEGRVLDLAGNSVAGAQIWVRGKSREDAHILARSGDEGTFRLLGMESSSRVWARAPGFLATEEVKVASDPAPDGLELRFTERAVGLQARVVDGAGVPVDGASLRIGDPGDDPKPIQLRSDAEGRAATDGLRAGRVPVLVLASGYQPYRELIEIRDEEDGRAERVFVLDPGWIAEGTLRDFEGEPQKETTIYADAEGKPTTEVTTGRDGSYRLECLPPGPVSLRVEEAEHRALVVPIQGNSGDVQTHDLVLPPWGQIAGRIVDESGQALSGWQVRAVPRTGLSRSDRSGETGAFSIDTEPELGYQLEVQPSKGQTFVYFNAPTGEQGRLSVLTGWSTASGSSTGSGGWKKIPVTWLGTVSGIREDVEIVIPADMVPSARIRGRVADAAGNPLDGSIQVHADGGSRRERLDKQGAFDIGPLIPGDYEFQVVSSGQGFPSFYLDVHALAPHEELDVGTILPPLGGSLFVSVLDGRAEPGRSLLRVLDSSGREVVTLRAPGPLGQTVPLAPGDYTVEALEGDSVIGTGTARVRAGETTQLSLELR